MVLAALVHVALGAVSPCVARAEDPPAKVEASGPESDPADAVKIAAAAFEYRDFQKVVDLLGPWVHPPRIADRRLMIEARRLLGLSYHVLGQLAAAREEFAQLLLQDPLHRLDPFTVPPKVIETFEAVKKEMRPTLDRILAERGQRPDVLDEGPKKIVAVEIPSRWVTIVPGGVPQFALDEPEWGVALGTGQLVGVAANVLGFLLAEAETCTTRPCDLSGFEQWRAVQYAGLGLAVSAYVTSVILGNLAFEAHNRALLDRAQRGEPRRGGVTGLALPLDLF